MGKPAKPLDEPPVTIFDAEPKVLIKINAPKTPPKGRMGFYEPGLFIATAGRFFKNGETAELPETVARRYLATGFAVLAPGQMLSPM